MNRLICDRDGEIKVLKAGWTYGVFIDMKEAEELVANGDAVIYDPHTLFLIKHESSLQNEIKDKVRERDGGKCIFCKVETDKINRRIHKLLGGKVHSKSNYITCCLECANRKNKIDTKLISDIRKKGDMLINVDSNKKIISYFQNLSKKEMKKKIREAKGDRVDNNQKKLSELKNEAISLPASLPVQVNVEKTGFLLYCDASYNEKRKTASIGYVIISDHKVVYINSLTLFNVENSVIAEFIAVEKGLEALRDMKIRKVKVYTDCQPVATSLRNPISKRKNKTAVNKIAILQQGINITYQWIPRKMNQLADKLSKGKLLSL